MDTDSCRRELTQPLCVCVCACGEQLLLLQVHRRDPVQSSTESTERLPEPELHVKKSTCRIFRTDGGHASSSMWETTESLLGVM